MSETVVLYLTTVIQLVIVCLSCDFDLLILSPLDIVKEFILALSGLCVVKALTTSMSVVSPLAIYSLRSSVC
jgi:hypothetical protein